MQNHMLEPLPHDQLAGLDRRRLLRLAGGLGLAVPLASLALTAEPAQAAVAAGRATGRVNVRKGPSTTYASMGVLAVGQVVTYAGAVTHGKWQPVRYAGRIGYVSNKYLRATKTAVTSSVTAPKATTVASAEGTAYASLPAATVVHLPSGATTRAKAVGAEVAKLFPQISTMYGFRNSPSSDHYGGRAVDIMLPGATSGSYRSAAEQALGAAIADHFRANAARLGVQYVIWHQHIWNIARDSEGWRPMANRGSDNNNHVNHVHVSVR